MSPTLFGFLLTAVAIGAFFFVSFVQGKVTRNKPSFTKRQKLQIAAAAAVPMVLLLAVAATPDSKQYVQNQIAEAERQKKCKFKEISSDRLADELMNHAFEINLIDVRPKEAFEKGHLPLALNIPLKDIFNREWENVFKQHHKRNVFYADDVNLAKKACLSTKFIGTSENYVLAETMAEFSAQILNAEPPGLGASKKDLEAFAFRTNARKAIEELDRSLSRLSRPVQKKAVKAKGGCS
jgi:rhodanese-related sulfurtransferase